MKLAIGHYKTIKTRQIKKNVSAKNKIENVIYYYLFLCA